MTADILDVLFRLTVAVSAGAVVVLVLRGVVRARFGARIAYGLWAIPVCMALAAAFSPSSLLDGPAQAGLLEANAGRALLLIWGAGALIVAAATLILQARFSRALGKPLLDSGGLPILRAAEGRALGPAVIGVLNPRIVLPADFEARYSPAERAMILAHERSHLFGHDAKAIALVTAARCVNWFNPLAYLAAHTLRVDQEMACDAVVMGQFPAARRSYAEALAKTQIADAGPPLGCQWPARGEAPLERRIKALAAPTMGRPAAGVLLVATLALTGSAAAWALPAPALIAKPPAQLRYWALLKDDVSLLQKIPPRRARSGETIVRPYEVAQGDYYEVRLTPVLQRSGAISVTADIAHDGAPTRHETLVLEEGEPRIIKVGARNLLIAVRREPSRPQAGR